MHLVADKRQIPVYAVEFKAPHKVTIPELVAGLHLMDLAGDVIDREGYTLEFMPPVSSQPWSLRYSRIGLTVEFDTATSAQERLLISSIPKDDPKVDLIYNIVSGALLSCSEQDSLTAQGQYSTSPV